MKIVTFTIAFAFAMSTGTVALGQSEPVSPEEKPEGASDPPTSSSAAPSEIEESRGEEGDPAETGRPEVPGTSAQETSEGERAPSEGAASDTPVVGSATDEARGEASDDTSNSVVTVAPDEARREEEADRARSVRQDSKPRPPPPERPKESPDEERDMRFVESNVVALAGEEGFSWQDDQGDFLFRPFVLVQTRFQLQVLDDEGLDLADHDNVKAVGFGVPNAIIGFAGRAFKSLSYNLSLNGACAGQGCLLNQAWLEAIANEKLRLRVGKFKTPMHWNFLARIGQKLAPAPPRSLTTAINAPFDLNAVNPAMTTGFDLGIMAHGLLAESVEYRLGVFNGEGIMVNTPRSTLSDDMSIPSLLYSARVAWMPQGAMSLQEGGHDVHRKTQFMLAGSTSYNVEANAESSNDLRAGVEMVLTSGGTYWATEAYALQMQFVERQRNMPTLTYWGGYTQAAHSFDFGLEPFLRGEVFDRNSTDLPGVLLMPAAGANYFFHKDNVKLQGLYQLLLTAGHENVAAAQDDDNSLAEHFVALQLQFSL